MNSFCPKDQVLTCPAGIVATEYQPGDFILVAENTFWSKLIHFGQKLRFPGNPYNKWTHVALIADINGSLIEADGGEAVCRKTLATYTETDYYLIRITASAEDRAEALAFANNCIGESYGWVTIASIALSLLTGLKFSFGFDGQQICSGLVARALERTAAIFPHNPSNITPCQLAQYYLEGGENL